MIIVLKFAPILSHKRGSHSIGRRLMRKSNNRHWILQGTREKKQPGDSTAEKTSQEEECLHQAKQILQFQKEESEQFLQGSGMKV